MRLIVLVFAGLLLAGSAPAQDVFTGTLEKADDGSYCAAILAIRGTVSRMTPRMTHRSLTG